MGKRLGKRDYVISSDEKTSIQARSRLHVTLPSAPHRQMRVEHHYKRHGAFAYLAAWDVGRARPDEFFGLSITGQRIVVRWQPQG